MNSSLNRFMKYLLLCGVLVLEFRTSQYSRGRLPEHFLRRQGSFCGTYRGRVEDEIRRSQDVRRALAAQGIHRRAITTADATQDMGQIAVIQDDGTIVLSRNLFDLSSQALHLAPEGPTSFRLTQRNETIGTNQGTAFSLHDDDTREIAFAVNFRFPFFGTSYSSVFINSDGNITFGEGDTGFTSPDLRRFNGGPPRIGGYFTDLDPSSGQGSVLFNALADRFIVTWNRVREFDGNTESSFQIVLFPDGSFDLIYGSVTAGSGIVGWTGGHDLQSIELIDLSQSAGPLLAGPRAEQFARTTQVDLLSLSQKFYKTHGDDYDQLVMFANFPFDLNGAFAFELTIKNDIRGINIPSVDFSDEFGSQGRLQSLVNMNQLAEYPDDPDTVFFGTNSTINILGQEAGHRWLAYPRFRDSNGQNSTSLLGRDDAHWSFFFNSDASVMEGNRIDDLGSGSFKTVAATDTYSKLDQYIMGFRESFDVGPLFYVSNVSGTFREPGSAPAIGVNFSGTRQDLSVNDIIAAEGVRIPTAAAAPNVFRQAFILVVQQGTLPTAAEVDKINRIRQRWQDFFFQATDGLGRANTFLESVPVVPVLSSIIPSSGSVAGGTSVYISGKDFIDGATVQVGSTPAASVTLVSSTLITALTPAGSAGITSVAVTNPGAVPVSLNNAFTYRELSHVNVCAGTLRIPHVLDNLSFRSNLGINNPTATTAEAKIRLLDNHGFLVSELAPIFIPPNGFIQKNSILRELSGSAAISGWEGSLIIESSQPLQAFLSQIDNVSGDPSILEGVREGSGQLVLQSSANLGRFRSNLAILNLAGTPTHVAIRAMRRSTGQTYGTPIQNLDVPAQGFVTYSNILEALDVSSDFGPIQIASNDGAPLVAVSRVSGVSTGTSGFFTALPSDEGSQLEIIPFVIENGEFRTNLGINNLGSATATVSLALIASNGTLLANSNSPIVVASHGMVQINSIVSVLLGNSSASVHQGYLRLTSDVPIKAFATQIDNTSNDASVQSSISNGNPHLLLKSSSNSTFRSTLVIVNPNDSPASVEITSRQGAVSNNGSITGRRAISIPARGQFISENILQETGSSSVFGPIEIRSMTGLPIVAVSRVYSPEHTSGFFNAEPFPE